MLISFTLLTLETCIAVVTVNMFHCFVLKVVVLLEPIKNTLPRLCELPGTLGNEVMYLNEHFSWLKEQNMLYRMEPPHINTVALTPLAPTVQKTSLDILEEVKDKMPNIVEVPQSSQVDIILLQCHIKKKHHPCIGTKQSSAHVFHLAAL